MTKKYGFYGHFEKEWLEAILNIQVRPYRNYLAPKNE